MKKCHACHQTLPAGARFCAYCGTELIAETFLCPHCQTENELDAAFCTGCGTAFQGQAPQSPPSLDELEHAIAQAFVMAFRERIESELDPKRYDEYVDRFYGSEFREGFEARVRQLAQDWQARHPTLPPKPETAAERLALTFDGMLDHFFITQCQDMAEVALPTAILNYESGRPPSNLGRMVLDYLDLENEPEPTYFNLVAMPLEKLKNATRSFFFPEKGEKVFFLCDLSLTGTAREGFGMTEEALYWKATFEPPQRVYYRKLQEVRREEDWITINGMFFNAGKSLNHKLMRLLKRLRLLYALQPTSPR